MSARPSIGAVVLAGALEAVPAAAIIIEALLSVPARWRHVRGIRAPLDLDADTFRYGLRNGRALPLRESRGGRICRQPHHRG